MKETIEKLTVCESILEAPSVSYRLLTFIANPIYLPLDIDFLKQS